MSYNNKLIDKLNGNLINSQKLIKKQRVNYYKKRKEYEKLSEIEKQQLIIKNEQDKIIFQNNKRKEIELNKKKELLEKFEIFGTSKTMSIELIKTAIENNKLKFEIEYNDDIRYQNIEFTLDTITIEILEKCNIKCGAFFDKDSPAMNEIYYIDDNDYIMYIETLNNKKDNMGYHLILSLYIET